MRHGAADPFERVHDPVVPGARFRRAVDARAGEIAEPPLDRRRRCPDDERHRAGGDQQRGEREREQRKQDEHAYTSILMTCLIQKNPTVCITTAPISMVCPIAIAKQQVHVVRIDERERNRERRRQREQHIAR